MPIIEIREAGIIKRIEAKINTTLAKALNTGHHRLDLPCGGAGKCQKCRVHAYGALSMSTTVERAQLGDAALANGIRLACQAKVLGNVQIDIIGQTQISQILTTNGTEILSVSPYYKRAGIAVDIGTTTIAATIFMADDTPDKPKDTFAIKNPQTGFGADVITRIQMALDGQGAALKHAVSGGIDRLVDNLTKRRDLSSDDIDAFVLTGNTAMLYLLTGTNPASLSKAPFEADHLFGEELMASSAFSSAAPYAKVYLPRCISAFIGADITTALLYTNICDNDDTSLLIDIGTNGEIVLWHEGKLSCCSTAAGPAFEGVGIENGTYAVAGAIDRVWAEDGQLCYTTINDEEACGICGSGIVSTVSLMLKTGVVDETGAMQATGHIFEDRIEVINGQKALRLAPNIVFSAGDVRKVQLAKGSIRAGIETLLSTASVDPNSVARFCIAGGFGNYIDIESAITIGLFPRVLGEKAQIVGNAALGGAGCIMQNTDLIETSIALASSARTLDLSANPVFHEKYIEYMAFE